MVAKPTIEYPCDWRYRLIGGSTKAIEDAAAGAVGDRPHTLGEPRESSGGRYVSLTLTVQVESEADRLAIHTRLAEAEGVQIVL